MSRVPSIEPRDRVGYYFGIAWTSDRERLPASMTGDGAWRSVGLVGRSVRLFCESPPPSRKNAL